MRERRISASGFISETSDHEGKCEGKKIHLTGLIKLTGRLLFAGIPGEASRWFCLRNRYNVTWSFCFLSVIARQRGVAEAWHNFKESLEW